MKKIMIVILSLMFAVSAQAQRRLHGQQGLRWTVGRVDGFTKNTLHTGTALSRFTKNSHQWTFGAEYLRKKHPYKHQLIPVEQFTAGIGANWS